MIAHAMLAAFFMDYLIADPPHTLHPVRLIGLFILKAENVLSKTFKGRAEYFAGLILAVSTILISFIAARCLILFAGKVSKYLSFLLAIFLIYSTISPKEMVKQAKRVEFELTEGSLQGARETLSGLVGRDTDCLDKEAVIRAAIETVSENITDGSVAPLFYAALGGPPLAMAYRAVNTLDSMVGYKNERYAKLGFFSAKLDDLASYIPARIAGLLITLAALITGKNWRGSLITMIRESKKHSSPNAGIGEAAMAGILGIELGGPSRYGQKLVERARLGQNKTSLSSPMISEAATVHYLAAALSLGLFVLLRMVIESPGGHL